MKRRFLEDRISHPHKSAFLRNGAILELSRQNQPFWDLIPKDDNDIGVRAVTDDDDSSDEGDIAPLNIIQLKGKAKR